ncbi:FimV/HubP family polar landmark protein [Shewanella waksmanii]|uniref:FimV/HubP family polar landmark protein n=1 Tax=Shewanella waksmanii TaxID=213783 RepID=UPI003734D0BA
MNSANQFKRVLSSLIFGVMLVMIVQPHALAKVSHVSINQQSFILGGYPNLRVNIVSQHDSIDKLQFIAVQASGQERLMIQPINNFMLQLTGVEDINDPNALLLVKEYRVNKWREVKRIALFNGDMKIPTELTDEMPTPQLQQLSSKLSQQPSQQPSQQQSQQAISKPQQDIVATQVARVAKLEASEAADHQCQLQTEPTQTLWRIGSHYAKQWQMSPYGAILAIYTANPKAFNKGNINSLRADIGLLCPTDEVKQAYSDAKAAKLQFEQLSQG